MKTVKVMGWQYEADGTFVGRQGYASDSFSRVNDDSTVNYQSHQLWERNTIWQLDSGWPFMLQWNNWDSYDVGNGASNVTIRDTTPGAH